MSDQSAPQVRVIWPPEDSLNSKEYFDIVGVTFDSSGVVDVEVTLTIPTFGQVADNERQPWQKAEQYKNSWSIWTSRVNVGDPKFSRILARAKDGAGNYGYYDKFIKFPDDPPPPPPGFVWEELHGVNYITSLQRRNEYAINIDGTAIQPGDIEQYCENCRASGFNLIRLVIYQESWEAHRAAVEAEIIQVCDSAARKQLKVIIDNHQWHLGGNAYRDSIGFPAKYCQGFTFPTPGSAEWNTPHNYDEPALVNAGVVQWWRQLWARSLPWGDVWADMANRYFKAIIDLVDDYESVIGYEFINEPQSTQKADYIAQGNFNTYMAQQLAQYTGKLLVYCRDNGIGPAMPGAGGINAERYNLIPRNIPIERLVYDNHRYDPDMVVYINANKVALTPPGQPLKPIKTWMGEYRPVTRKLNPNYDPTKPISGTNQRWLNQYLTVAELVPKMKNFIAPLKAASTTGPIKYASSYWAYGGFRFAMDGVLVLPQGWTNSVAGDVHAPPTLTNPGLALRQAIAEVY